MTPLLNDAVNTLSSRKLRARVVLPTSEQKHSLFTGNMVQNLREQIEYAFNMRLLENQDDKKMFNAFSAQRDHKAEPWVVDLAKKVVKATDKDKAYQGPNCSVEEFTVTNFHNDDNTFMLELELSTIYDEYMLAETNTVDARIVLDIRWTKERILKKILEFPRD